MLGLRESIVDIERKSCEIGRVKAEELLRLESSQLWEGQPHNSISTFAYTFANLSLSHPNMST